MIESKTEKKRMKTCPQLIVLAKIEHWQKDKLIYWVKNSCGDCTRQEVEIDSLHKEKERTET